MMARVHDKTTSRLIHGLHKVMDRQNAKPEVNIVDFGMQTYIHYKNKKVSSDKRNDYYWPLRWQPLRYVIKPVAHTHYTYTLTNLPWKDNYLRKLKRYKQKRYEPNNVSFNGKDQSI